MQKEEVKRYVELQTGKFGLGVQNEAEQRLTEHTDQENIQVVADTLFQQLKR